MDTPRTFLCYAPRAGLRCAIVYLSAERDAYGWFVGQGAGGFESAYFVLQDYYTRLDTRYIAVAETDLHTKWTPDEAMCHELAQLQDAFAHEWLFTRADPQAAAQIAQYADAELATGEVNVRFERLNRFSKLQAAWTHYSQDFEDGVLKGLSKHWPLDVGFDERTTGSTRNRESRER